jgi:hypothetical protein
VGRRGSVSRAAALRRAQQAKAGRDAERVLRERQIEIALADYFEATATAERLRADARHKADGIVATAEEAAAEPEAAAREAVRRLRELTGSHGEVAALCGITVAAVRDMLTTAEPPGLPGPRPDTASGAESGREGTGHGG